MSPRRSSDPRLSAWMVVVMFAMVAVPAAITLNAVRSPGKLEIPNSDPTPHGYTWSLLFFVIPIIVIAFGFLPREEVKIPRKAFWWTIGILVPLGFATDFFFASRFFVFPNAGATLGIGIGIVIGNDGPQPNGVTAPGFVSLQAVCRTGRGIVGCRDYCWTCCCSSVRW